MNLGDLRACTEGLPDSMELIVCHGMEVLHPCGLGTATAGVPANYNKDGSFVVVRGLPIFEITVRDNP